MKSLRAPTFAIRLTLTLCCLALLPTSAAAETDWQLRAYGQWLGSSVSATNRTGQIEVSGTVGDGLGAGLGLDVELTRRFGLGLDVARGSMGFDITVAVPTLPPATAGSDLKMLSLTLSLPVSIRRTEGSNLYVAPLLGWVSYNDLTLTFAQLGGTRVTYELADETAVGARLGFDKTLGNSRWSLHAHVDYLRLAADGVNPSNSADRLKIDTDPYAAAIGFGWSF
jgi:hypothetical protein